MGEGGEMLRWGVCRSVMYCFRKGCIYMTSSVSDSCRVWDVRIKEPGTAIGYLGDLKHFREVLESKYSKASFCPKTGQILWITDTTPHESLPSEVPLELSNPNYPSLVTVRQKWGVIDDFSSELPLLQQRLDALLKSLGRTVPLGAGQR